MGWNYIRTKFNEIHRKSYHLHQFKNKFHAFKKRRSEYLSLINHTGFAMDPLTMMPTANEEVWDEFCKSNRWAKKY
uniref:Myb/SANT-like domain-containing protein n=1 Tax=Nelumbo nucifera TaxID=4432 RepID=A0A822ZT19_NELNU|nr:TPA_asm: hypothetical protein HUJ06_016396 [Nelumbo nucifera]